MQFKQLDDHFPQVTIFSVIDLTENYTFEAQKEIQSEYYHSDQVSIFSMFYIDMLNKMLMIYKEKITIGM